MQETNVKLFAFVVLAIFTLILTGCRVGKPGKSSEVKKDEAAAAVNGKVIKFEEVERAIKSQAKGQESKLSPLELAQARLQVLEQLIQQEVMYQKAKSEQTIPTDDDVIAELNKMKTNSGVSKEEFEKKMEEAGETEDTLREKLKRELAINKLIDKVAGKVEPPSNKEIEDFYNGNKEAFIKKRGVQLAAIVIDPRDRGQGDTTTNRESANLKAREIVKKLQGGADFATLAASYSEDPSKLRKGDLGYISEEQMKQTLSPRLAEAFMREKFKIGSITPAIPLAGKIYIFKLQDRKLKDEKETLETSGVRQRIADILVKNRKNLLSASYAEIAMNEAKIENYLAKKVVENPNELSGARPAKADTKVNGDADAASASKPNAEAKVNKNADKKLKVNSKANASQNEKKAKDKK